MREIIRKIEIPQQPRTGIMEERQLFAKMIETERRQARAARYRKVMEVLRLRWVQRLGRPRPKDTGNHRTHMPLNYAYEEG